jgi:hypothetical protein
MPHKNSTSSTRRIRRLLVPWLEAPLRVWGVIAGRLLGLRSSWPLRRSFQPMLLPERELKALRMELKQALHDTGSAMVSPGLHERELVRRIEKEVDVQNRNNVTRTMAYLEVYRRHPELHWAFLAHMVSRNGGWSMTDLKGEWLTRLMKTKQAEHFFGFLERANALIFQDAYPQLRLYEESVKAKRSLFHLLPMFHVSAFMRPFWEQFWASRQPALLTTALIINEQNYIEARVVQNEGYKETVLDTLTFQTQALLQLNQVLLPYGHRVKPYRLAGAIVEDFSSLTERIRIGRTLYAILFGIPEVHEGAQQFAFRTPHSGSRHDLWPHLFASVRSESPGKPYTERLNGCGLLEGASRLYSPRLKDAWADRPVEPPDRADWFHSLDMLDELVPAKPPLRVDLTDEYCFSLRKIELAVIAGQVLEPILP